MIERRHSDLEAFSPPSEEGGTRNSTATEDQASVVRGSMAMLRCAAGYRLAAKPLAIILLPCYSFSGFWKLVSSIRFGQD